MAKFDWNHTGGAAVVSILYRGVSPVFLPGTGRKKAHAIPRRNAPVRACRRKLASGFQRIKAAQLLNATTKYRVETVTGKSDCTANYRPSQKEIRRKRAGLSTGQLCPNQKGEAMNQKNKCIITLMEQANKLFRHCRQGSYKTRERYFAAFKRFLVFLAATYGLQKIANISGKHLSVYVRHMQENKLSASTIKTDLAAIRFWHDQIPHTKHKLPDNDEFELERRSYRGHDRTWTETEFAYMLSVAKEQQRDDYAAAMTLSRYLGLRIHEVFRIDAAIARAAFRNGYITIKGKGGKIRDIPNRPETDTVLLRLLEHTLPGHKLLLPPDKKTHHAIKELQQFIADHRPPREGKAVTFHGLRHMFAAEAYQKLIAEGKSEKAARLQVSRWLGHEREDAPNIYLASIQSMNSETGGVSFYGIYLSTKS